MFYVYEWFIVETGEIIYVGKGTRNRYKVRKHNHLFNEMIKRFNCDSRIVKEFDSEQDAFEYEYIRINELKEKGECSCNVYAGGRGGTIGWWTDERRKEYSEKNVMKSEKQRKRMSQKNPMKNKNIAERVNGRKRKPVIIGNIEYESIKEACKELNTSSQVIANWCKKGVNDKKEICYYKGEKPAEFKGGRYNKGSCLGVVYKGVTHESVKDFSESVGISYTTANVWLKRGFDPSGNACRYVNDDRVIEFVNRHVQRNKNRAKPVIVNDVEYTSCEEASKALSVPKSTLYSYLQGKKKNPKYICRYGDQQPSRGNVDKSTTEGSTTNE